MGLPKIKFTPEAIFGFVANHGEKILVGIVVLCSLPLAWGGINALRLKTRSSKEDPAQIMRLVENANSLLNRPLPTDQQTELNKNLGSTSVEPSASLEAWNPTEISRLSVDSGLNRPLLGDIQRRQVPVIFPLEQLVANAGVVAIANQDDLLMDGDPSFAGGFSDMEMMEDPMALQPTVMSPPAKKMPYIILSGLIPFRKQLDEYSSLYSRASYQSAERDLPIWHDYAVERLEVRPDGGGKWKVIDITRLYEDWKDNWAGTSPDSIPQQFILPSTQNLFDPADVPIGYWSPLPALAAKPTLSGVDGMTGGDLGMGDPGFGSSWGLQAIHPWAKEEMKKLLDEQKKLALEQQDGMGFGGGIGNGMESGGEFGGGMAGTTTGTFSPFQDTEMGMDDGTMAEQYDDGMMMGYGPDGEGIMLNQDYCLFRFIDTSVEPGRLYRYRVTLRAWNPNWNLPKKFLENPESGDEQFVQSVTSEPFPSLDATPVHVPADNLLLARLLLRDEKKTYGLGVSDQELLVLDSNEDSGNFEMHSIESKPGEIVGSKKGARKIKQFNNRRISVPPHNVDSDQTLLAVVGQQTIDGKKRPGRGFIPPEPLEILIADSAGILDVISADACEETVREYLPTLPGFQPPQAVDPNMMDEMEMMGF
ncbi:MAG: hypothetical protein P8J43_07235 [Pirellulales bacterium]|nr:hypothetical protein [Pirellulales bacterium]